MGKPNITTNTGKAKLVKQGHTTDGKFGNDPQRQVKGGETVRDLGISAAKK